MLRSSAITHDAHTEIFEHCYFSSIDVIVINLLITAGIQKPDSLFWTYKLMSLFEYVITNCLIRPSKVLATNGYYV